MTRLPSSDEIRDCPLVPKSLVARAALGAQPASPPPRHPMSLPYAGTMRGGWGRIELVDVVPGGAF